jgi:hypothetical protein
LFTDQLIEERESMLLASRNCIDLPLPQDGKPAVGSKELRRGGFKGFFRVDLKSAGFFAPGSDDAILTDFVLPNRPVQNDFHLTVTAQSTTNKLLSGRLI